MQTTLKMQERAAGAWSLPAGIRIENEMAGVRYILPQRNFGKAGRAGIGFIVFGIVITVFMVFWMGGPIGHGILTHGPEKWMSIGFGLMGLPGLAAGIGLIMFGLAIFKGWGHSEILVSRDTIWGIEKMGPITLSFKRPVNAVEKMVVTSARTQSGDGACKDMGDGAFCALREDCRPSKGIVLGIAYPREMLKGLAENLASSIAALSHSAGTFSSAVTKTIPVVEETADGLTTDTIVPKPSGSAITLNDLPEGFALVVPPAGLFKGSKGLFFFSLLWNGFMVFFTAVAFFAESSKQMPWQIFLFIAGFWAIGIGLLLGAVNMGRRQTIIAVVGGTLGTRRTGLFGTKETKFRLEDIATVKMGPSGMEVNDVPVMELQILGKDGKKKQGVLSERNKEELLWMAWLIRNRLGIGKSDGNKG